MLKPNIESHFVGAEIDHLTASHHHSIQWHHKIQNATFSRVQITNPRPHFKQDWGLEHSKIFIRFVFPFAEAFGKKKLECGAEQVLLLLSLKGFWPVPRHEEELEFPCSGRARHGICISSNKTDHSPQWVSSRRVPNRCLGTPNNPGCGSSTGECKVGLCFFGIHCFLNFSTSST